MANDYDVVIIGTGVAGALVAWKLAEAKCKVLVLDAGEERLAQADRDAFVKAFAEAVQNNKTPSEPYVDPENRKFARSPDVEDFKVSKPGENPLLYFRQAGPDVFKSQYQRLVGGRALGPGAVTAPVTFPMISNCKRYTNRAWTGRFLTMTWSHGTATRRTRSGWPGTMMSGTICGEPIAHASSRCRKSRNATVTANSRRL
jgi:choline dehydrogenase-like flavoprotein